MAREIDDSSQEADIAAGIAHVAAELGVLEMRSLFTGEHDGADAIVQINAKDGGVDAQDWAELLMRMFTRWAERKGFVVDVDDVSPGTEAGIMSAEFTIKGRYAYGLMTSERGTHRLVRISPFDNQGRRQTSFASVQVWPVMDAPDLEVNESEIRMEVFRASGAGGQHVNKTSSAVRLIHEPTGAVATSQEERSQLQNKERAMQILRAKLYELKLREQQDAVTSMRRLQVGTGSRSEKIRTYNYKDSRVTDHRLGQNFTLNPILEGDIETVIQSCISQDQQERLAELAASGSSS
jgi:protein subunit release factor A